jgi:hypothetical protein
MKKLIVIVAVICLASPVMAADWNFTGSERFDTFYNHYDTDTNKHISSTNNTQWEQAGNGRLDINAKLNDKIGGAYEIGFESGAGIYTRKFFGTYNFDNGGQLLIGQTYTPTALFLSNSVFGGDGDLLGIGEYYDGRLPMVQLKMGGFKIALLKPNVKDVQEQGGLYAVYDETAGTIALTSDKDATGAQEVIAPTNYSTEVKIPKIEASYSFKSDQFFTTVFAGYQTYDLNGTTSAYKDQTINSYLVGFGGGVNLGALYIHLGGHYGQNLGNFGAQGPYTTGNATPFLTNSAVISGQDVKDTECWGAEGVLGFNASDMLTIEAGGGYEYGEQDVDNADGSSLYQVYLNATINIAPGFFIVPEVGYVKSDGETYGASPDPNPTNTYFGAKWQIDF